MDIFFLQQQAIRRDPKLHELREKVNQVIINPGPDTKGVITDTLSSAFVVAGLFPQNQTKVTSLNAIGTLIYIVPEIIGYFADRRQYKKQGKTLILIQEHVRELEKRIVLHYKGLKSGSQESRRQLVELVGEENVLEVEADLPPHATEPPREQAENTP